MACRTKTLSLTAVCGLFGRLCLANPNVLIVDDEKNIRLTLAATLEAFHLTSEKARNDREALQKPAEKSSRLTLIRRSSS
jgi:DNA-binding NtrC family response regulator